MIKRCPLLFRSALLLTFTLVLAQTPIAPDDDPARHLATVASRQQRLAELVEQRNQLHASGDKVGELQLTHQIIQLHVRLFDFDSALNEASNYQPLAEELAASGQTPLLADHLILYSRVHIRRNEIELAIELLNRALQLSRDAGYRKGEAGAYAGLGRANYDRGKRAEAETNNNAALQILRDHPDKTLEAQVLILQGEVYMVTDRPIEAINALKQSEAISRSLDNPTGVATALMDLNFEEMRLGQWQNALGYLNQIEDLNIDKDAEPYLAGQVTLSFGLIYEEYGQWDTAWQYLQESLIHYRDRAHDKRATVDAARNVARVQAARGDYAGARQQIEQVLPAAFETKDDLFIGLCYEALGQVWLEARVYESARAEFLKAIEYFSKADQNRPLARAQIYLGQTEQLLGNLAPAATAYNAALRHFEQKPDYTNEAAVRFGLGKLALQQGKLDEADTNLKRSIDITERLRENAWSRDLRSSFLSSVHKRYSTYVELLMARNARNPDPELEIQAFEVNEKGRGRALLDSLHDVREVRQLTDPTLANREVKLQMEEQRLVDERAMLAGTHGSEEAIAKIDEKLRDVHSSYEALQAQVNVNPGRANLLGPSPLNYKQIQSEVTNDQTSLLSYSLGSPKSFAWLVTENGLRSYELPDKETIENASKQLLERLSSPAPEAEVQPAIAELSRLVLEPISTNLNTSRLIVIGDGALQYIPFQLLKKSRDATDPLIVTTEIVQAPSASILALLRKERSKPQRGTRALVAFGDAVFSPNYGPAGARVRSDVAAGETRSEEVSKLNKLPRLFNAKRELNAIGELAGTDAAFFTEFNATRANLLTTDLTQFRVLHLVTHGVFDANRPESSGLVLSLIDPNAKPVDGFVGLHDIFKLRAPNLVVLSACYTALGQQQNGEGLVGMMRGFMHAGASGVVASLWQVDDRATAELMKHFYENMLQGRMGPAAALRDAQNKIRSQPEWSSPYYWAGFSYQGDYDLKINVTPARGVRPYGWLIASGPVIILLAAVAYWYFRRRSARAMTTVQH
ncbi:MAG TPA: CHAT domain-containing tetratricopeptide repeat protein [Pyrinomonadaceae bacterium]|nr:CHAT domain-containing tetratricopeptide repeat protein [Pyrinomonadaceae bacterium]